VSIRDPKEYQSEGWTDLLESLEEAFGNNSIAFKKETAHAFVPTVNRMKECFHLCEEQNKSYGEGILMLNSALKKYEMMVVKTEDDMKGAYSSAQVCCWYQNMLMHQSLHGILEQD
jgi:hypothetical protein